MIMNEKITCDICRDLIPLVKDGVASADSEEAVRLHAAGCSECALLLDGKLVENVKPSESPRGLRRAERWLTTVYAALMLLGLYVGVSFTDGEDMFFNTLLMPFAGALGYLAFRKKSLWIVPSLILIINVLGNFSGFFPDKLDALSIINWALIYSLFALAGIIAAMLLKFAFGKDNSDKEG